MTEEELVRKYSKLVLLLSRRFFLLGGDSEDLYQDGMIGLLYAFRTYDENRGIPFDSYASVCIRRKLIDAVKSRGYAGFQGLEETELAEPGDSLEDRLIRSEQMQERLSRCSEILSRYENRVLDLFLQGYTLHEIADALQKSVGSVYNALARVRQKFSAELI